MTDIVERLRRWAIATDAVPASDLMDEAADEIERLREAIRRLADQDATLSVQESNVTVTMDAAPVDCERFSDAGKPEKTGNLTLTDAEREAVEEVIAYLEPPGQKHPNHIAAALRLLLERTK